MSPKHARLATVALSLFVGACTTPAAGGSPAASTAPVALSSPTATAVPTAPPASAPGASLGGPQPTAGDIDPCALLTQAEASTLMGKSLSAGVSTLVDQDRVCTFNSGTSEVKLILAPPAPDAATAQADWDAELAQAPSGITLATVPGFDRAAYGSGASVGVSVSAMFVIQGNHFFDLYCGFPACSPAASVTAAQLIVGRLP
jgi:hypothetical protein